MGFAKSPAKLVRGKVARIGNNLESDEARRKAYIRGVPALSLSRSLARSLSPLLLYAAEMHTLVRRVCGLLRHARARARVYAGIDMFDRRDDWRERRIFFLVYISGVKMN